MMITRNFSCLPAIRVLIPFFFCTSMALQSIGILLIGHWGVMRLPSGHWNRCHGLPPQLMHLLSKPQANPHIFVTHVHQNNSIDVMLISICNPLQANPCCAKLVFSTICMPKLAIYNHMVRSLEKSSLWMDAIVFYRKMMRAKVKLDHFTRSVSAQLVRCPFKNLSWELDSRLTGPVVEP